MKDPKVVRVCGLPVLDPIDERILGSVRRSRRPSRLPTPHQAGVGRKPKAQRATPPGGFALIDLMPSRRARVRNPTDPGGLSRSGPRSDGLQISGAAGKGERHAADRFVCDSSAARARRHPLSPTSRSGYRPRPLFCIRCAGCLHSGGWGVIRTYQQGEQRVGQPLLEAVRHPAPLGHEPVVGACVVEQPQDVGRLVDRHSIRQRVAAREFTGEVAHARQALPSALLGERPRPGVQPLGGLDHLFDGHAVQCVVEAALRTERTSMGFAQGQNSACFEDVVERGLGRHSHLREAGLEQDPV